MSTIVAGRKTGKPKCHGCPEPIQSLDRASAIMLLTKRVNDMWNCAADLDIQFGGRRDAKLFSIQSLRVRKFGDVRARLIGSRLDDLHAADSLADMRNLPGRCHELTGDREGTFSIDLDGPYRLLFKSGHIPVPLKPDGGIDWTKISSIIVLGVENTHE